MHIISKSAWREFVKTYPDSEIALARWHKLMVKTEFVHLAALKAVFPSVDYVDGFYVFNIGGNKYRLIAEIYFDDDVVLVRHVLTHAQYDKGKWKNDNDTN